MKKRPFILILSTFLSIATMPAVYANDSNFAVNAKADIETVLELQIDQTGQSELRFGNIRPSALEPTEAGPYVVTIHVVSNIGSSYHVTQSISNALENAEGQKIDSENLKFKTTANTKGTVISTPTPVTKSSQTIFISDPEGTSDTIKAEYTLTVPPSQAAGDYSALLTYTVSSL